MFTSDSVYIRRKKFFLFFCFVFNINQGVSNSILLRAASAVWSLKGLVCIWCVLRTVQCPVMHYLQSAGLCQVQNASLRVRKVHCIQSAGFRSATCRVQACYIQNAGFMGSLPTKFRGVLCAEFRGLLCTEHRVQGCATYRAHNSGVRFVQNAGFMSVLRVGYATPTTPKSFLTFLYLARLQDLPVQVVHLAGRLFSLWRSGPTVSACRDLFQELLSNAVPRKYRRLLGLQLIAGSAE